jgi:hypothetical protein
VAERFGALLEWIATGGVTLDTLDVENPGATRVPTLVPDVLPVAHQAVHFSTDVLGDAVVDELHRLVAELRRRGTAHQHGHA